MMGLSRRAFAGKALALVGGVVGLAAAGLPALEQEAAPAGITIGADSGPIFQEIQEARPGLEEIQTAISDAVPEANVTDDQLLSIQAVLRNGSGAAKVFYKKVVGFWTDSAGVLRDRIEFRSAPIRWDGTRVIVEAR